MGWYVTIFLVRIIKDWSNSGRDGKGSKIMFHGHTESKQFVIRLIKVSFIHKKFLSNGSRWKNSTI